jgi:hypothetical protein
MYIIVMFQDISYTRVFLNCVTSMRCTEIFDGWPLAEVFKDGDKAEPAQFLFVYDFACGALASIRARLRAISRETNGKLPDSVACWALHSKWVVDKFHFKNHVGVFLPLNSPY